jgi:hypothetical protein
MKNCQEHCEEQNKRQLFAKKNTQNFLSKNIVKNKTNNIILAKEK